MLDCHRFEGSCIGLSVLLKISAVSLFDMVSYLHSVMSALISALFLNILVENHDLLLMSHTYEYFVSVIRVISLECCHIA